MTLPQSLTWLHLSDAHIGDPRHAPDAQHVLETLARDLKAMRDDRGLQPDLVFFTGDAAFGQLPDAPLAGQYREVAAFLDGVCAAFNPVLPKQRLFLVPGNHDVNRDEASEDQRLWLESLLSSHEPAEDRVDTLIRDGGVQWKRYMERLLPYAEFLQASGYGHLLTDARRLCYAQRLDVNGCSVGILGLNTAWSCAQHESKGKLWLGRWQLNSLYDRLRDCSLKIVLSHHPFNWLTDREDPRVAREVSQMFDFHLHGHEHEDWIVREANHTRIAAGACYDRSSKQNGYNFVRIDRQRAEAEVHLRSYDRQGRGWVPRCIHRRTSESGIWLLRGVASATPEAAKSWPKPWARCARAGPPSRSSVTPDSARHPSRFSSRTWRQEDIASNWLHSTCCSWPRATALHIR